MHYNKQEIERIAYDLFEKGESRDFLCQRLAELNLMLKQIFPSINFLSTEKIDIMKLESEGMKNDNIKKPDENTIKYFADSIKHSKVTIQELHWLIAERKYLLKKHIRHMKS
jgi:hypothetical protein